MFNPHENRYRAVLFGLEGDIAILQISNGIHNEEIKVPGKLIPKQIKTGDELIMNFIPIEHAEKTESESLRMLLKELLS